MKKSIDHPDFTDKTKTTRYVSFFTGKKRLQYDSYARWVGGSLEDLYIHDFEKEGWVFYKPTIKTLLETHCPILHKHMNSLSFKLKSLFSLRHKKDI